MSEPMKPTIYLMKNSCKNVNGKNFEYWETEICIAENPDDDFKNADKFVEFSEYQAALDEIERQERELRVLRSTISRMNTETIETLRQQHAEIDKLKRELWSLKEADGRPYDGGNVADK